jgi:hypothetical protein
MDLQYKGNVLPGMRHLSSDQEAIWQEATNSIVELEPPSRLFRVKQSI